MISTLQPAQGSRGMQQIGARLHSPVFPEMYKDAAIQENQKGNQSGCFSSYFHILFPCWDMLKKDHDQERDSHCELFFPLY